MNSTLRQFFTLLLFVIMASALGSGIGNIIIAVAEQEPRGSPDCSCVEHAPEAGSGEQNRDKLKPAPTS